MKSNAATALILLILAFLLCWANFLRDPKENKRNEAWLNLLLALAKNKDAEKQLLGFVELLDKSHSLNLGRLVKSLEATNDDLPNSTVPPVPQKKKN